MGIIYSVDFRKKVLEQYKKNKNKALTARIFNLNYGTVAKWVILDENGKDLKYVRKGSTKKRKIQDLAVFEKMVEENSGATLHKLAILWQEKTGQKLSFMAIKRTLIAINFTHKKCTTKYKEACTVEREKYIEKVKNIDQNKIFYIDESRFDDDEYIRYGWSKKGKRAVVTKKGFAKKKSIS